MSQFASAVIALQSESKFAKAYEEKAHKSTYWEVKKCPKFLLTMYYPIGWLIDWLIDCFCDDAVFVRLIDWLIDFVTM